jgi:hypothetical protein
MFAGLVKTSDNVVLAVMGELQVTFHLNPDVTATCVPARPPIEEELQPGTGTGTGVLYVWTRMELAPALALGVKATVNNVVYDVILMDVDRENGCLIKMRRSR